MREMKYSGVEWIGDIPKSWNTFPIKHAFTIGRGRVISNDSIIDSFVSYLDSNNLLI